MPRRINPYSRQNFGAAFNSPQSSTKATNEYLGMMQDLDVRIGKLTEIAFEQTNKELIEEGKQEALDNPIDIETWANTVRDDREDLLSGNTITNKGKAIQEVQFSVLSANVESSYDKDVAAFYNHAVQQDMSEEEFYSEMSGMLTGYKQAMEGVSPETFVKFSGAIDTTANTYNKSFLATKIAATKVKQQIRVEGVMDNILNNGLKVIVKNGWNQKMVDGRTGTEVAGNLDDLLDVKLEVTISNLARQNATQAQISSFISEWRSKIIEYKKDVLYTRLDSPKHRLPENRHEAYEGVLNETFNDDLNAQALFHSLSAEDQQVVKKSAIDWIDRLNKVTENAITQKDIVGAATVEQLKLELITIKNDKDSLDNQGNIKLTTVYDIQNKLQTMMSADEYENFNDKLEGDIQGGLFIDPIMKEIIEEDILTGDLSLDQLVDAKSKNYISEGTYKKYLTELETLKKDGVKEAVTLLKLNYLPEDYVDNMQNKIAQQKLFAKKKTELTDYINRHRNLTKNDIVDFAQEIISKENDQEEKDTIKEKITKELLAQLDTPKFRDAYNHFYDLQDLGGFGVKRDTANDRYVSSKRFTTATHQELTKAMDSEEDISHIKITLQLLYDYMGENNPIVETWMNTGLEWTGERLHMYSEGELEELISLIEYYENKVFKGE